jgi:hypothetical protein
MPNNWHPIVTAPKDGRPIRVMGGPREAMVRWISHLEDWALAKEGSNYVLLTWEATHWAEIVEE